MACPHGCGSPQSCSQCIGVTPRLVARGERGEVLVDGVPLDRPFQPGSARWPRDQIRRGRPRKAEAERRAATALQVDEEPEDPGELE